MVSSGSPSGCCLVISAPRSVPKVRSVLVSFTLQEIPVPSAMAVFTSFFFNKTDSSFVFSSLKSYAHAGSKTLSFLSAFAPSYRILLKSIVAFLPVRPSFFFNRSVRPTISSTVLTPSFAMYSRSCCAIKVMKLMTYSGFPIKRLRSSGFWVAIPIGQVSRLQTRIMTQPRVTSGAVAKPNSSAPRSAAIATSLPLMSLPSVSMTTRFLRPFCNRV